MRERLLMNKGWRYFFGMPEYIIEKCTSFDQHYRGSRGENARGPARRDFDDSAWRTVTVPHDFVFENGVSDDDPVFGDVAGFPRDRGEAWYRRTFKLDEADKDKQIILHFEAVATKCEVYVNSMLIARNDTAGIGFDVDITEVARFGYEYNVVSVHVDCHDYEAWYYEGGGIVRNVWLQKTDKLMVDLWGTFVKSKSLGDDKWQLTIETEVANKYYEEKTASLRSHIIDPNGKEIACTDGSYTFPLHENKIISEEIVLDNPMLWDTKHCNMHKLITEIVLDGEVVDTYETNFGIREIVFDADHGMFINGKSETIYGFSNHNLYLGVGNAMSDSMREYHIRTIAEMGGNGFRTVHSPHGEATYDYCDKWGILIMDENRVFQPNAIRIDEVKRMIKRDRNHPSVCMWSLYNEEDTITRETGKRIFRLLAAEGRKYDDTRPMTGASSYGMFSEGAHEYHDIYGFNHQTMNFDQMHALNPDKPIFCSERVSPIAMEPFHAEMKRVGEDLYQFEKEYVIGGFHFTAWEFTPEVAAIQTEGYNGTRMIDALGKKGPCYYAYQTYLKHEQPLAKISPDWDFPGSEGKEVGVFLCNSGDYVEVYINGAFKGKFDTDIYGGTYHKFTYEPGEMKIVSYKNGKVWAEDVSKTSGKPAAVKLVMENPSLKADDTDVAIITAYLVDSEGNICRNSTGKKITFSANEAGEFMSAVSLRYDGLQGKFGPEMYFFNGMCQAFFRSMDTDADLIIRAESREFETAELVIKRKKGTLVHVPEVQPNYILDWQISKLMPYTIDDEKIMEEGMIERWEHIDTLGSPDVLDGAIPDRLTGLGGAYPVGTPLHYAYHAYATVPELGEKGDKKLGLYFEGLDGFANIYITDGEKRAFANHPSDSPWFGHYRPEMIMLCDEFKPGDKVEVWVMMHNAGRVTGIGWPVRWVYTTEEEAKNLEEKTLREWRRSCCYHG
ncbi:MAG: glycoside hydrolase family 2 protein [Clostridiales bacterium]|nr:glycoside hydrolase family 2 protein [Clostridiales bacterium]